jgi:hypothetical protein
MSTPRPPDRFERTVSKQRVWGKDQIVTLLRREHAAVRRLVKSLQRMNEQSDACMDEDEIKQYGQALTHILAALDKRRR